MKVMVFVALILLVVGGVVLYASYRPTVEVT
jgi:hypothetical protein